MVEHAVGLARHSTGKPSGESEFRAAWFPIFELSKIVSPKTIDKKHPELCAGPPHETVWSREQKVEERPQYEPIRSPGLTF